MLWLWVNWLGVIVFSFGVLIGLLIKRELRFLYKLLFGIGLSIFLNLFLKYLFLVPRIVEAFGPSFPSFHTQMAFFIAAFVGREHPRLLIPFLGLATLVGISRYMLGLHTLIDIFFGAVIGMFIGISFYNTKMKKVSLIELGRQSIHFLGIILVPLSYYFPQQYIALALIPLTVLIFITLRRKVKPFGDIFLREREKGYHAAIMFLLSLSAVLFFFSWKIATAAIFALCIGDSLATTYGRHFGTNRIVRNKTLEGSIVGFLVTYLALYFILGRELALITAFVAVLIELLPFNDNITIPIGVALFLKLVGA